MQKHQQLKILLVEDDQDSMNFFMSCFQEEYNILCASSGEEALEYFEQEDDIAMVLSDQAMPGMTGVELLTHIYQQNESVIRIIITGFLNTADIIAAINKGHIYQFIVKPWELVQMRMVLSQARGTWQLRRENDELQKEILTQNYLLTRANKHLHASKETLRNLSISLFTAREEEQRRIAMELHDELGQSLAALKMQTRIMENDFLTAEKKQQEKIKNWSTVLRTNISQIIEDVRLLSKNLSPVIIEDLGLDAALQQLINNFTEAQGISCSFQPAPLQDITSTDGKRIVYRLVQESLNNICNHAKATHIDFSIKVDQEQIFLSLVDNGKGFHVQEILARPQSRRGIGLTAMSERVKMLGGTFDIQSIINQGTTVSFTIPFDFNREEKK
ncbi:response regulator [Desulfobulbus sp. US2]|uniref:Oxygen sensor histidine kinase NreB n=1 Tax=Candidatus Electrothrix communis TaxID=1859133 RepID=A0A3S3QIM0_9BACT|nr:response regulator [Desulfobulbus sp. US4]MCW5208415.1 response regulator [Desulfobulbus sp. US2]MCW5213991.1 response regulator [Desulfobulbus sp. US5]RWX48406.1 Histidine kinase-, DNA gyrase B-, and HSP90-like ATPase [Candidatus Electrothrix communis]WLE97031.1 MAG: response regulator [Candidatus Electrothrix communis]